MTDRERQAVFVKGRDGQWCCRGTDLRKAGMESLAQAGQSNDSICRSEKGIRSVRKN